jgi:ACS family tartrate transporter-like MFS transporter
MTSAGQRAVSKSSRRILPFLFCMYIVAYLDRANVTFAKLPMMADLGFSEAVFGLGAGLFFLGYFVLEIPGAIIVERRSARLWLARIMISWGVFTVLIGFVRTPAQFYGARFLLGLAEAGFFPGMIVYLTHWFPARVRASAMAGLILGVPISFVLGAPISAACLSFHALGMPGWRWIFILQGLPAVILGIVAPFYLTDRPADALWLDSDEREWLTAEIQREQALKRKLSPPTIWQALAMPHVLWLALALCLIVIASYGYIFWLPTTVQKHSGFSTSHATLLSAVPFACATAGVWWMGRSSDRTRERKLHTAIPLLVAGASFLMITAPGQPFTATFGWLCLTGLSLWAWAPSFWVLPTLTLGESVGAASIGFINSIGNLGGFLGPSIVGCLLASGRSFSTAVIFLCACFFAAAAILALLPLVPAAARTALCEP